MTVRKSDKLADEYVEAEKRLLKHLNGLRRGDDYCDCDEPKPIETVYSNECNPMVVQYCLKCGGSITP
jgi:hypothetical protein